MAAVNGGCFPRVECTIACVRFGFRIIDRYVAVFSSCNSVFPLCGGAVITGIALQ